MVLRSSRQMSQSSVHAQSGMVTANQHLAADAGAAILAQGGNAVDAAIATSFAVGVVEPAMSGIAGRGYMVIHFSGDGSSTVIDGHERAPRAARPDMYQIDATQVAATPETLTIPAPTAVIDQRNSIGHLAVAVPGVVGALAVAHQRYGALPFKDILQPAIALAAEGFEVSVPLATMIARTRDKLARFPSTAAIFLRDGLPLRAGDRLVQSDLARTFELLAEHGPEEFYQGSIAAAIAEEMQAAGGIITRRDLAEFQPRVWERPLIGNYRGYQILTVPDATGGIGLLQMLNLLEGFDLSESDALDPGYLHLLIETLRTSFQDRLAYMDDPDFGKVPFHGLASKEFATLRRQEINAERARDGVQPGNPWAFEPESAAPPAAQFAPIGTGDHDTTHFCAVDRNRTIVSMTQSIVQSFGSGVVVPGTGMLLNNAMSNFDPTPGALGSIAPWRRSVHNGTPAIVLNADGSPRLAIGGAGGRKIITGMAQVLVNVLDRGWDLQDAVAAPRVHNEGWDTQIEDSIPAATRAELERLGHRLEVVHSDFALPVFSRINGIAIDDSGMLSSGVDIYSDAGAAGLEE